MTKYLFCVFGTPSGDLDPCLVIGQELVRRGHAVTVASHESYGEKVAEKGIDFIGIRPAMDWDEGVQWFEYAGRSNVKEWRYLARLVCLHTEFNVNRIAEGADFDVILCTQGTFFVPLLAEKLGIPWGMLYYQPVTIPPELTHSLIVGRTWKAGWLRRIALSRVLAKTFYYLGISCFYYWLKPFRTACRSLGLPTPTGILPFAKKLGESPHFNIAMFSSVFSKLRTDYPKPMIQAGFVRERNEGTSISKRTDQFLENGDSPLLFSFGTFVAATSQGKELFDIAVQAFALTDTRAVVIGGKVHELRSEQLSDQFIVSEYEPFPELLPKVSLVIHVGGMRTVIAALRAGVPQLILPFTYEQCDNAFRLQNLGVARMLPVKRCNLAALTKAIKAMNADSFKTRAATVSAMVEDEDAAIKVADYLEHVSRARVSTANG